MKLRVQMSYSTLLSRGVHDQTVWTCDSLVPNVLFFRGSIKRLDPRTTYRYMAETLRVYSYRIGLHS